MVNHPKSEQTVANRRKQGIFWDISFFWDYILGKENTHIPSQLLDSSFLDWDYIPEQRKSTRHSTTTRYYNSSTFSELTLQRLGSARTLLGFLGEACCS